MSKTTFVNIVTTAVLIGIAFILTPFLAHVWGKSAAASFGMGLMFGGGLTLALITLWSSK